MSNPFHADIILPLDGGKDFVMEMTIKLADRAELALFDR